MAGKSSFAPEEWARIVASPMVAGMAITAAEPSGVWGLLKESMSGGWALLDAKRDEHANPLVRAVAEDIGTPETRTSAREHLQEAFKDSRLNDAKAKAIEELRAVSQLLDRKAPEDATAFKSFLTDVARRAAESSKEGGFLGFGGVAVSSAEKATLEEISGTLGPSVQA